MNETICTSESADRQSQQQQFSPAVQDPLKQAVIANASLRLHLRRFRRDLVGPRQLATTDRLLDATASFGRALEWLRGGPVTADDGLDELEQLALESAAMPEAIGVSQ